MWTAGSGGTRIPVDRSARHAKPVLQTDKALNYGNYNFARHSISILSIISDDKQPIRERLYQQVANRIGFAASADESLVAVPIDRAAEFARGMENFIDRGIEAPQIGLYRWV